VGVLVGELGVDDRPQGTVVRQVRTGVRQR
jgi:hypothetical protein